LRESFSRLTPLGFERTTPFCYSCYQDCSDGQCKICGSDDLMRHLKDVGVEYGTDWVIKSILEEALSEIDLEESFEQMIDNFYGQEVQIGFIKMNVSTAIKNLDPIAWNMAKSEYLDTHIEDESVIDIGEDHYWKHDLESLLNEQ